MHLKGKVILVTRAETQAQHLVTQLGKQGAEPIVIPVIEFGEPSSFDELDTAIGALEKFDWIVFASSNAASAVHKRLTQAGKHWTDRPNPKVAAIGSATSKTLSDLGIDVDFQPGSFVAERFVAEFSATHALPKKRILWPRTLGGRLVIADQLTSIGADVTAVEAYSTKLPQDAGEIGEKIAQLILAKKIDVITLASSQSAKNFFQLLQSGLAKILDHAGPDLDAATKEHTDRLVLAVIGPVTAATTRKLFGRVDVEARVFTADGLVSELISFYGTK
ncbi:MAG: uroporphyrinogen-III synthase [Candidatus Melainabacteria bacterium]|nr:uroporphyrinogen-III synthase [Candidatus Melainabacteria bacterium]